MGVFHVFKIVQKVPNPAKRHICVHDIDRCFPTFIQQLLCVIGNKIFFSNSS